MASRIAGITIEIGGDTTKLQAALKDVDKTLKTTQTGLRDVNKLLKLDPTNVDLLKQKQGYLTDAIKATEEKLKTEKEALRQMKDADSTGEVTEKQQALEREIADTETKLASLKKEYKDFGSVASQQLKAVGEKMKAVGEKTTTIGKGLTAKVTTPIVGGFGAAIKTTADFEEQMSKVQAITGSSGKDMDVLNKKAREMGAKTKFSATEAGQAMEYMGMAGWKTKDIVNGLEGIMNLAAASGEDLGTTSDIVTDALTAFGLTAKDSGRFANVLAAASTNANTNVSMMGESFKYVAPVAGAMGYSVEDVSVALGLMANSGIKASSAGTSLRTLLTNMAKPTDAMAMAMDELGISLEDGSGNMKSFDQVMQDLRKGFGNTKIPVSELEEGLSTLEKQLASGEITEKKYNKEVDALMTKAYGAEGALKAQTAASLAGKTGMSGLLAIVNASDDDYNKLTKAIRSSSDEIDGYNGQAEKMAGIMQDNLKGQLTILLSQLQELAISVGETLMPTIKDLVSDVQGVIDWLNKLDKGQKDTIIRIGLVVAAAGPLLVVIGTIISSIGTIVGAIGGLIGLITGGGGAVAAAGAATAAAEGVTAAVGTAAGGGLIATIGSLAAAAAPFLVGGAVVAGVVAGGVLIVKNWDTIKAKAADVGKAIKKGAEAIQKKFGELKKNITKAATDLASNAAKKFDELKTKGSTALDKMKTSARASMESLRNNASQKIEAAKSAITTGAAGIAVSVGSKFSEAKNKAATALEGLRSSASNKINAAKNAIATAGAGIVSSVGSKFTEAKNKAATAAEGLKTSVSQKLNAAKSAASTAANGIKSAIATNLGQAKSSAESVANGIKSALTSKIGSAASTIKNKVSGIAGQFSGTLKDAISSAGSAVDRLKDKVKTFKWKFPHIDLPHFKINTSTTKVLGKTFTYPTGFDVKWYKKAYENAVMFTRPTVLQTASGAKGFGDGSGGEVVLSDKKLRQIAGSGSVTYNVNVYGAAGQNVNELANAVQRRLVAMERQKEAAGLA